MVMKKTPRLLGLSSDLRPGHSMDTWLGADNGVHDINHVMIFIYMYNVCTVYIYTYHVYIYIINIICIYLCIYLKWCMYVYLTFMFWDDALWLIFWEETYTVDDSGSDDLQYKDWRKEANIHGWSWVKHRRQGQGNNRSDVAIMNHPDGPLWWHDISIFWKNMICPTSNNQLQMPWGFATKRIGLIKVTMVVAKTLRSNI